jgi:hypothetical protein
VKPVEFHPDASQEAHDAVDYSEGLRVGLGDDFRSELDAALALYSFSAMAARSTVAPRSTGTPLLSPVHLAIETVCTFEERAVGQIGDRAEFLVDNLAFTIKCQSNPPVVANPLFPCPAQVNGRIGMSGGTSGVHALCYCVVTGRSAENAFDFFASHSITNRHKSAFVDPIGSVIVPKAKGHRRNREEASHGKPHTPREFE